jgi:hypothetical protein
VSGSERVYVNGTLLNVAKIMIIRSITMQVKLYTPLFTITSEMRIAIEYQFSDRNYTVLSGRSNTSRNGVLEVICIQRMMSKTTLATKFITEQAHISKCGDNRLMTAPSAYSDTYSENKVLSENSV